MLADKVERLRHEKTELEHRVEELEAQVDALSIELSEAEAQRDDLASLAASLRESIRLS